MASSQPLASHAGLQALLAGGNAADAAVAMAAVLAVTEPCSTGLGGDAFALHYCAAQRSVSAINGSGRSPAALPPCGIGGERPADSSGLAVTVPGAAAAWGDVLRRHGSWSLARALAPAIALAREGFPVGPVTAHAWRSAAARLRALSPAGCGLLAADGEAPRAGALFANQALANVLETLAAGGTEAFYSGWPGAAIVAATQSHGGCLALADLAAHASSFEAPLSLDVGDHTLVECGPNGQGVVALRALQILQALRRTGRLPASEAHAGRALYWHALIEALRVGFAEALAAVTDPDCMGGGAPARLLLDPSDAAAHAAAMDLTRASPASRHGAPFASSDTVYFCAVDAAGNAVSFANSNYKGFGTCIVPAACGFSLQNRGLGFVWDDPSHANAAGPAKRPYHTIIPAMLLRADGTLAGPLGVMGGFQQPQAHVQVVLQLLWHGADPQAALDAPRISIEPPLAGLSTVAVEDGFDDSLAAELTTRFGHRTRRVSGWDRALFGRGQIVTRAGDVWAAGSDGRADGMALGF